MENSPDAHRRSRSIRVALWVGWLWFALVFFIPGTIMNMGRKFLLWLPLLVVLICVNRQSAREWFQSSRTAMPAAL